MAHIQIKKAQPAQIIDHTKKGGLQGTLPFSFIIPLPGVDAAAEKERLQKRFIQTAEQITILTQRLDNPEFRQKAPQDVQDELRLRLQEHKDNHRRYQEALARLALDEKSIKE